MLLAVDLGLRTGWAAFDQDGVLRAFQSRNFGSQARLKRGAKYVLEAHAEAEYLLLEGDRNMQEMWTRAGSRFGMQSHWVQAETWRRDFFIPSERRSGSVAKRNAIKRAHQIIETAVKKNRLSRATSLRHDAAEAICMGHWFCRHHDLSTRSSHTSGCDGPLNA